MIGKEIQIDWLLKNPTLDQNQSKNMPTKTQIETIQQIESKMTKKQIASA